MPKFKLRTRFCKALLRKDAAKTVRPEKCILPIGELSKPPIDYLTHFQHCIKEYVVPRRVLRVAGILVRTVLDFANCKENRECFSVPGMVAPMPFAANNYVLYSRVVDTQSLFARKTYAKHEKLRSDAEEDGTIEAFGEWYQKLEGDAYRDVVYSGALPFVQILGILTTASGGAYSHKHWEELEGTEDEYVERGGWGRSYYVNIEAASAFCKFLADKKILTYNEAKEKPLGQYTDADIAEAWKSVEIGRAYSGAFAQRVELAEATVKKKGLGKELMLDLPKLLCKGNVKLARWKAMAVIQKFLHQHHPECLLLSQLSAKLNEKEALPELHTHANPKLKVGGHAHFSLRETSAFAMMPKEERTKYLASQGLDAHCFDIKASALTMAYMTGHGELLADGADLYACANAAMGRKAFASKTERDAFKMDVNVARSSYDLDAVARKWCRWHHKSTLEDIAARKGYLIDIRAAVAKVCRCLPDNGFYVLEGLFTEWCREYLFDHGVKHVGIVYDEVCIIQDAGTRTHEEAAQLYDEACRYALEQFLLSGLQAKFQENFKYTPECHPVAAFIAEEDIIPAA